MYCLNSNVTILSSLIACCPILNVLLENEVRYKQGKYEGAYSFQGFSNERDSWVDAEGENAIWYIPYLKDWAIGSADKIGMIACDIKTSNNLEAVCPNNEGYILSWDYLVDLMFTPTEDIYVKCANENEFCTSENPCGTDEGDCDTHDECQDGLFCRSNNCPDYLGFHSEFDCCYVPTIGDENFCSSGISCGENEGDCDSNSECQSSLFCGYNNCPVSLGFDSEIDCCSTTQVIESPNYPNSYPNNAEETWLITSPIESIINLQFHSFDVRLVVEFENTKLGK